MDNTQFNKHVDECLNKVEVKTILENEKRQLSSSSSSSGSSSHSRNKKLKRQVKRYNQMLLLIEY
jgi:DNA polymerase kappa